MQTVFFYLFIDCMEENGFDEKNVDELVCNCNTFGNNNDENENI